MKVRRDLVSVGMALVLSVWIWSSLFISNDIYIINTSDDENTQFEMVREYEDDISAYVSHAPIYIVGDAQFLQQAQANGWNVGGRDGLSPETAFLIHDYSISGGGGGPASIDISSTSYYFIIANNYISGGSQEGIIIINSPHCVRIENNTVLSKWHGIDLRGANNVIVQNNQISNCAQSGIRVDSDYLTIKNNTISIVTYNAIWLENAEFCNVSGNQLSNAEVGIFLDGEQRSGPQGPNFTGDVVNNTITDNNITDVNDGIQLVAAQYNLENNTISNNRITGFTEAGISIRRNIPTHNLIEYNNITYGSGYGIYLYFSVENRFTNNLISNNGKSGIIMDVCSGNEFLNNSIQNNAGSGFEFVRTNSNNDIIDNFIMNNSMHGISMIDSYHQINAIQNNTIGLNNGSGIFVSTSETSGLGNIIQNNTIYGNNGTGISIENLANGFGVRYNRIYNNLDSGIYLDGSIDEINVLYNELYNNTQGIVLNATNHLTVIGNTVYNTTIGIQILGNASFNSLILNSISDPDSLNENYIGIYLSAEAHNNTIKNNVISDCDNYGIYLETGAYNNSVMYNSLLSNYDGGTSQGYDNGTTNIVDYNHWSDWTSPDSNSDGIVDVPYDLDGEVANFDPHPLTDIITPDNYHQLTNPSIIYPNGGEIINETALIQWAAVIDTVGHDITYTVFYSANGGSNWVEIGTDIVDNSYLWDTSSLTEGSNYLIRIWANCTEDLYTEDISDAPFTVQEHDLSPITLLYPNGNELVEGICTINWTKSFDSWEHQIVYSIYYSFDSGVHWITITTGLTDTSYAWNTFALPKGPYYLVRVVAECTYGLLQQDESDSTFSLIEHELSNPTILYPNGGEIINETAVIQWAEVFDTQRHDIVYTVFYSDNSGSSWVEIETDIEDNSYLWDTSSLTEGSNYLIRVWANCTEGHYAEDVSDAPFTVQAHELGPIALLNPNGDELVEGIYRINWTEPVDSWEDPINYSIYSSGNSGQDWTLIASDLHQNYYDWDTSIVPRGTDYLVKVIASCTHGLDVEDVSDSTFILEHIHTLTNPTIITPNGGEMVNGSILIQWTASNDLRDHDLNYTLYYSTGGGWIEIDDGIQDTQYLWDTSLIPEGSNYIINVTCFCSEGLTSSDVSDYSFTIQSHALSIPTLNYPTGGELINGTCLISWQESTDVWEHSVTYSLYYSNDGGATWHEIVAGYTGSSYIWDVSELNPGSNYLINVTAICSEGLAVYDISELFTLNAHTLSTPTILYPSGGEQINESITIIWDESRDSWEDNVTYTLYFSNNGGSTWYEIATGLEVTSYFWDPTPLADSTEFMIRVVATCDRELSSEYTTSMFAIQHTDTTSTPPMDGAFIVMIIVIPLGIGSAIIVLILFKKGRFSRRGGK
ncbi:MAG: right-handed parallel beta-helix repeat-containing protein [Candidatus Thorarchaeota archaeon]